MSQKILRTSQNFILLLAFIFLFNIVTSFSAERDPSSVSFNDLEPNKAAPQQKPLYYFAYGSNMLTDRINIQNRNAINLGAAILKGYRLNFEEPNICFGGLCSTLRPKRNAITYGVLYRVTRETMQTLDQQEMVPENVYFSFTVPVMWLDKGIEVSTFTYQLTEIRKSNDPRPSKTYLQCLVKGAQEARLPSQYIRFLKSFNHTDVVDPEIERLLQLQNVEVNDWATSPLH